MDARENSPTPDDSPLTVSTEEIERLLQRAESLVSDIADGVGLSDEDRSPKELLASPFPDKSDALEALEQTAKQVDRVEEHTGSIPALNESETEETTEETKPEAEVQDEAAEPVGDESELVEPTPETIEAVESPPKSMPAESKTQPATSDTAATPEEPAPVPPAKRRNPLMAVLHVARAIALFPLTATVRVLVIIDTPFARLRPTTKLVLGLLGLVSLIMGIAAFFLPKLLARNPYEGIPPYSS